MRKGNPVQAVKNAAKAIVKPLKDAAKQIEETVEQEAPRPAPKEKPEGARLVRGLGERIGFAGIVAATVVAVLLGATGCDKDTKGTPSPAPVASCKEEQPCFDCHTMGNKVCGPEDVRR